MFGKSIINWRQRDQNKLSKEIKRFNDKIYRTLRKNPTSKEYLPSIITREDKKQLINNLKNSPRSEFNKTIKSLDRFSKRGAEKLVESKQGIKTTKWEKKEIGIKVATINRERTRERKKADEMEVTTRGKSTGLKRKQIPSGRTEDLHRKSFNFDKIRVGKEWELYKQSVNKLSTYEDRQKTLDRYKENYIKALDHQLGDYGDYIKALVEKLPSNIVVDLFYSEQEADLEFIYDPIEMENKIDILEEVWQRAVDKYDETADSRF